MSKTVCCWLAAATTIFCRLGFAQTWSEPMLVSQGNTAGITWHAMTTDLAGRPWCGWVTWCIPVNYYEGTWSIPDTIYPVLGFASCDLTTDANGNVWVIAEDFEITAYCYNGSSWSNLIQVPTQGTCSHYPVAAGDTAGNLYACWTGGGPGDGHHVWGNVYADSQWGSPVLISVPGSYEEWTYSMVSDKQGRVWVGWHWFTGPPAAAIYTAFNDGGNWSDTMILAEYTYAAYGPALTVDTAGRVWAGWIHADSGAADYSVSASYYDGNVWSEPVLVGIGYFDVAITSDDKNVVWMTWCSPDHDINYSYWDGIGWSDPAAVDTHPADDYRPKMTYDGERIWVTWWSNRDGFEAIYASYTYGVGVAEKPNSIPTVVQCYPNPFRHFTTIRYTLPRRTKVRISIYDVLGHEVGSLVDAYQQTGGHQVDLDLHGLASGIYICEIKTEQFTANSRLVLIK